MSIQVKISYIKEHHREIVLHQINDIVRQLNDNSRKTPIVTFPPDIHQPLDLQNSTPAKLNACQVSLLMNLRNKFVISGTISFYKRSKFIFLSCLTLVLSLQDNMDGTNKCVEDGSTELVKVALSQSARNEVRSL